jgi:hypothetical protein
MIHFRDPRRMRSALRASRLDKRVRCAELRVQRHRHDRLPVELKINIEVVAIAAQQLRSPHIRCIDHLMVVVIL